MSIADAVFQAMRGNCIYRPCDIAAMCQITTSEAGKILKMLERGGVIDLVRGEEYRRKRMYTTRQKGLF